MDINTDVYTLNLRGLTIDMHYINIDICPIVHNVITNE